MIAQDSRRCAFDSREPLNLVPHPARPQDSRQCVAIFQAGQKAVIEKLCKAVLGRGVCGAKPPTVHTFFPLKKMLLHVILGIFLNLMRKKKRNKKCINIYIYINALFASLKKKSMIKSPP